MFLEKVLLPLLISIIVLLAGANPWKFDWRQRISGAVALIAAAYFLSHTLAKSSKLAMAPTSSPLPQSKAESPPQKNALVHVGSYFTSALRIPNLEANKLSKAPDIGLKENAWGEYSDPTTGERGLESYTFFHLVDLKTMKLVPRTGVLPTSIDAEKAKIELARATSRSLAEIMVFHSRNVRAEFQNVSQDPLWIEALRCDYWEFRDGSWYKASNDRRDLPLQYEKIVLPGRRAYSDHAFGYMRLDETYPSDSLFRWTIGYRDSAGGRHSLITYSRCGPSSRPEPRWFNPVAAVAEEIIRAAKPSPHSE